LPARGDLTVSDFTGRWFTTFGPMDLAQEGENVRGTYGQGNTIRGTADGGRLTFRYEEPGESGQGWFGLPRHGKFAGEYLSDGVVEARAWEGVRGFDGIWDTSFGRMRLIQEEDRVFGFYEGVGPATVEGTLTDGRLVFTYQEPAARGQGWFDLADDGRDFGGRWQQEGTEAWHPWVGRRVLAAPGQIWLVVLEAHWQRSLADNEYAFGHMLREFFARLQHVKVRQRFFHDEASLQHWCRELLYLPEPAVLMIASHGSPEGLSVHGKTINTDKVVDCLRYADNLRLLHFSSCLVMQDGAGGAVLGSALGKAFFPISGYTTSVDWGGSALIEFTYLDMILAKGLTPARAAEELPRLLIFAGDDVEPGAAYPAAGFRYFAPRKDNGDTVRLRMV
jgi:hypothetical protein